MGRYLAANLKSDYQKNYRRFEDLYDQGHEASRIWVVGLLSLIFSMSSDFLLGAAAGVFGVYFYQIVIAYMQKSQAEDAMEDLERWFSQKGLTMQDKTAFFKEDQQLETPLNLFEEAVYQ